MNIISSFSILQGKGNNMIRCSRETGRQISKLLWGLNDTHFWFHQTLTFAGGSPCRYDIELATIQLNRLLDWLVKKYPDCAVYWVREFQKTKAVHFHLLILFWGNKSQSPKTFIRNLRPAVFNQWQKLSFEKLFQGASQMTLPEWRAKDVRSFSYLLKNVRIAGDGEPLTRGIHFWGWRNKKLILENSTPLDKCEVSKVFKELFPHRKYVRKQNVESGKPITPEFRSTLLFRPERERDCKSENRPTGPKTDGLRHPALSAIQNLN